MNETSWLEFIQQLYSQWTLLAHVVAIVIAVLVVNVIVWRVLSLIASHTDGSRHIWRDALVGALNAPLRVCIWIIGLTVIVDLFTRGGQMPILAATFGPARDVTAIAVVVWFAFRLVGRSERNVLARARSKGSEIDATAADAIGKLIRASVIIVAVLAIMQQFGFSIASLLTFGGVAGIAVGFAAQGLVANLFGGLTIYASRPFKVGEGIIFPGTNLMGQVEHIGWRATRILGWNGKPFYVPNAKFNTETIINNSRIAYREISQYIYVRLEDINKVAAIVADVNEMLNKHPEMGDYIVFRYDSHGDYALKLYLYAYTVASAGAYAEYMRVKEDVLLKIDEIITQHGAELAVPVSSVRVPEPVALQGEYGARDTDQAPAASM